MTDLALDHPGRIDALRRTIQRKPALRQFYREVYEKFAACLGRCPAEGKVLELGSGGGFIKELIPEAITSDVLPYQGLDQVVDACRMPFADESLRAILMFDTLHHIPDAHAFFREAERCLVPGGRIFMVEPHVSWWSTILYRFIHHEDFDPRTPRWQFNSSGPLSDANTALPWIIFRRDEALFAQSFPRLECVQYFPHTPLRYWLAGGLKAWSLLPGAWFRAFTNFESRCLQRIPGFTSFVDIEVRKR